MNIDRWAANVRLTVVDGTNPVSLALELSGSRVAMDKMAEAIGVAVQKQIDILSGQSAKDKRDLEMLREKVRVFEEANAAEKKAREEARSSLNVEPIQAPKPRGRPRKADK